MKPPKIRYDLTTDNKELPILDDAVGIGLKPILQYGFLVIYLESSMHMLVQTCLHYVCQRVSYYPFIFRRFEIKD